MWNFFNPDNELMHLINKAIDMILLSLIWLLLSATVIGFGPATTALYYAVVKTIRRERGSACGEFFRALRESWKVSLIIGLVISALAVSIFFLDLPNLALLFTGSITPRLGWKLLSLLKTVIVVGIGLYVFPLISRYQVDVFHALFNAFSLSVRYFGRSFLMAGVIVVCFALNRISPLFLGILPALTMLLLSFFMEPVLRTLLPKNEADTADPDPWYLE